MLTLESSNLRPSQINSQSGQSEHLAAKVAITKDSDSKKRAAQNHPSTLSPLEQLLFSLLENETQLLENLLQVLEAEKSVLGNHDLDALENTIREKALVVAALEKESQKRFECVAKYGVAPNSADWLEQLTPLLADQTRFLISYDYIVSLTNKCRDMNKNNGLLINHREGLTSKVINVLRTSSAPDVYSDSGQSKSSGESRVIGKA